MSICIICRSNGMINLGFLFFSLFKVFTVHYQMRTSQIHKCLQTCAFHVDIKKMLTIILLIFLFLFLMILPLCIYFNFIRLWACRPQLNSIINCNNYINFYKLLQTKYWNVGFLYMYKLTQIGNFLLSAPMYILLTIIVYYWIHYTFLKTKQKQCFKTKTIDFITKCHLVHITHIVFIAIFIALFAHIQIITRMICSACPLVYLYCAILYEKSHFCRKIIGFEQENIKIVKISCVECLLGNDIRLIAYNNRIFKNFISISNSLIFQDLQNKTMFSLTLDEYTGINNRNYMNINIHTRLKIYNTGLIRISGSAKSEKCVQIVKEKMLEFGFNINKEIVCATTDEFSVMMKL
ncbi:hypothetical protein A3Q56_02713 [Intoshia linei]|uniref:GPI mannosyltransferase 2 n=1 Tax=Intoshia linei TaxID=1819745 RepID=A0A177B5I8_9BILA|nr:hypothetical protein A3Q56_02713 [Intoshia linei]